MEAAVWFPINHSFKLPIANLRNVFRPHDVERKLAKLPDKDHENLRTTYERMLERGPERFQVKPSGVPDMAALYEQLPNFTDALDDVKRHVALSQDCARRPGGHADAAARPARHRQDPLRAQAGRPAGHRHEPGADELDDGGLAAVGRVVAVEGRQAGQGVRGLVDGQYANPVIVVDEIDKASADAQYDPLGALYSLLEHDTAEAFMDEFAEVAIDASQVIWIMTANDERCIPEPILNRMNVFEIEPPSLEAARQIARNLYRSIRGEHGWGARFDARARRRRARRAGRTGAARDAPRADDRVRQRPARPARRASPSTTCPSTARARARWASCSER